MVFPSLRTRDASPGGRLTAVTRVLKRDPSPISQPGIISQLTDITRVMKRDPSPISQPGIISQLTAVTHVLKRDPSP